MPGGGEALLSSRLGAVCGCLGDCRRAAGDLEAAAEWYERSAEQLRLAGEKDIEVGKREKNLFLHGSVPFGARRAEGSFAQGARLPARLVSVLIAVLSRLRAGWSGERECMPSSPEGSGRRCATSAVHALPACFASTACPRAAVVSPPP